METKDSRFLGLDGLRGASALIVVAYHVLIGWGFTQFPYSVESSQNQLLDIFSFTPARILLAGGQAVHIFFVISGFVLAEYVQKNKPSARRYLVSRMARLYLPVWPALALALLATWVVNYSQGSLKSSGSLVLNLSSIVLDASLLPGAGQNLGVLWSLTWEVLFSILIVLVLWIPKFFAFLPLIFVWLPLVVLGDYLNKGIIEYLPMFLIGVLLTKIRRIFAAKYAQIPKRFHHNASWLLFGCALTGITSQYTLAYLMGGRFSIDQAQLIAFPLELLSIVLLILLVIECEPVRNLFSRRPLAFMGRISFSLYLTHQSVLKICSPVLPKEPYWAVLVVVVSVLFALGYYKVVESKMHQFSRKLAGANPRS